MSKKLSPGELVWVSLREPDRFESALIIGVMPLRAGHYGCEERVTVFHSQHLTLVCDCEIVQIDKLLSDAKKP